MGVKELHAKVSSVVKKIKEKNPHLFSEDSIFSDSNKAGSLVWIYPDLPKFPPSKTHTVSGIEYNHNASQPLPEIIGKWFYLNSLEIVGYKAGDCTCKTPKLEWRHLLRVQWFNETRHPKTRVRVVTVLAWTKNNYKASVNLVCKYK